VVLGRHFKPCARIIVPGFVLQNLDGDGLLIEWTIQRDNTNNADEGEVSIYNLSPTVSGAIFETWQALDAGGVGTGMTLDFHIGYDQLPSRVMLGDVWNMKPNKRVSSTDVVTTFMMGDGNRALSLGIQGTSFHNVDFITVLGFFIRAEPNPSDAAGGGLGLSFPKESADLIVAASAEIVKRGGSTTFGNVPSGLNMRDNLDAIMATLGLSWRIHNGAFIAMRGGALSRPGPILRPGNGLISYDPVDNGGVELTNLARTDMEPGSQFQVQDDNGRPFAEPLYRATHVAFAGSTSGNSIMTVSGQRRALLGAA
jgi:hypothetical protein